jgi:hypothetical protein
MATATITTIRRTPGIKISRGNPDEPGGWGGTAGEGVGDVCGPSLRHSACIPPFVTIAFTVRAPESISVALSSHTPVEGLYQMIDRLLPPKPAHVASSKESTRATAGVKAAPEGAIS